MPLGRAGVVKLNLIRDVQTRRKRIVEAHETARNVAEQSLQTNVPVLSGALKASSKAERLPNGIGFEMRSYGNEAEGRAYAYWVNFGHTIVLKSGGTRFVSPQPYFSQAVADARAKRDEALKQLGFTI